MKVGRGGRSWRLNSLHSLEMTRACNILFPTGCPHKTVFVTQSAGTQPPRAAEEAFLAAGNQTSALSSPGHSSSQQTRVFLTCCRVSGGV